MFTDLKRKQGVKTEQTSTKVSKKDGFFDWQKCVLCAMIKVGTLGKFSNPPDKKMSAMKMVFGSDFGSRWNMEATPFDWKT